MTTFGSRVAFTWLTDLPMEELRGELSRLQDHTVVLLPDDVSGCCRQTLHLAPGAGCVRPGEPGGWMVTFEQIGRKAAQLGIRILAGEDAQAAARSESYQAEPIFDWHQLRRAAER
jgi:hypothetical protein